MAPRSNSGISETEVFWSLIDKADIKFSKLRDSPSYGRNRTDPDFHKAFKIYTRLWKMQQENRQKLMEAGLKRWEIGEIASRIAQLYYLQYQRTSDSSHLSECYMFYEAVLTREYFKDGASQETGLVKKQLRFLARFLVVCLLLCRREMVVRLAGQLKSAVDDCRKNFQDIEFREWKLAVHNIHRFMKADSSFMNMRPLRYSYFYDTNPVTHSSIASSETKRTLSNALLCSYHQREVKFAEVTLDTFRMLQCLEWEPCGSFPLPGVPGFGESAYPNSHLKHRQEIRDPALPSNPKKIILARPLIAQYLLVLATLCEELSPTDILLVYLSVTGKSGKSFSPQPDPSPMTNVFEDISTLDIATEVKHEPNKTTSVSSNKDNHKIKNSSHECCLWLGSQGNEGSSCLYPCDLIPFTRKPLFLIIDSDVSHSFKAIHGVEKGEPAVLLLSPRSDLASLITGSDIVFEHDQNGSLFTIFLTAPLQAFCLLLGVPNSNMDTYDKAEKLLLSSLNKWDQVLMSSDSLNPVWIQAMGDPFLRRLVLRFLFCRNVLSLLKSSSSTAVRHSEFIPECLPALPDSVLPNSPSSLSAIKSLADFFNLTQRFCLVKRLSAPD